MLALKKQVYCESLSPVLCCAELSDPTKIVSTNYQQQEKLSIYYTIGTMMKRLE